MESKGKPDRAKRANGVGWPPARYRPTTTPANGPTPLLAPLPIRNGAGESKRHRTPDTLRQLLRQDAISVLPLRLLVALAWLWSYATMIVEPGWRDGSNVTAFFVRQVETDQVVFPLYRTVIADIFVPHATLFGWVLLIGQLVVGICLLFGVATNAALFTGIAINAAALLAGVTEPSVLAIVVLLLLRISNAGTVLGVDEWFARTIDTGQSQRAPAHHPWNWIARAAGTVAAVAVATYAGFYATDWRPLGLFHDPAAMLTVLAGLVAALLLISCLQTIAGITAIENEASATPGWPAGWEPISGITGDSAAIDHLGRADLEWHIRGPLPEWAAGTAQRRQG